MEGGYFVLFLVLHLLHLHLGLGLGSSCSPIVVSVLYVSEFEVLAVVAVFVAALAVVTLKAVVVPNPLTECNQQSYSHPHAVPDAIAIANPMATLLCSLPSL